MSERNQKYHFDNREEPYHYIQRTIDSSWPPEGRDLSTYERELLFDKRELEGKVVLDLGAGLEAKFAKQLKEAGIKAEVISLSPDFIEEKYRTKSFLLYGSTKLCGENFCSTISDLYGLDTTVLRYFYVYGPRYSVFDHSAMVNFINLALRGKPILIYGKGDQLRDYTYIEDVVEATILALKNESTKEKIYNISSGFNTSISDLAATIVRLTNSKSEIKAASHTQYRYIDYCRIPIGITSKKDNQWIDERNYIADISLAKKELGYFPKISLEDGILKTVNWMSKKI